MRPRHYAADNGLLQVDGAVVAVASMRPRHYAADNRLWRWREPGSPPASMRPRHYAADNHRPVGARAAQDQGFNEAAALRRG